MAYGVRFRLTYTNEYGVDIQLDIREDDYSGAISQNVGGYKPISIGYQNSGIEKFKTINPSYIDIELMAIDGDLFDDLMGATARQFDVKYYEDSVIKWSGFIDTNKISRPFKYYPYVFKCRAVDGLIYLKNESYGSLSYPYEGKSTLMGIIINCLDKLEMDLDIHTGVNLYSEDMYDDTYTTNQYDPIYMTHVDQERFIEDNEPWKCDSVLDVCLGIFGAEIHQDNGVWNITRVSEKDQAYTIRKYSYAGIYIEYESFTPQVTLTDNNQTRLNRLGFINADAIIEVSEPLKKITININRYIKPSLYDVWEFEGDDLDGNANDWYNSGTLINDWTVVNRVSSFGISQDQEGRYFLGSRQFYPAIIEGTVAGSTNNKPTYCSSLKSPAYRILSDSNTNVRIEFEYRVKYSDYTVDVSGIMYYFIVFTDNFGDVYYYKNNNLGWVLDNGVPTFSFDRAWKTSETRCSLEFDKIQHNVDLPQSDGTLHVEFFQMAKAGYNIESVIKNCSFRYLYNDELLWEDSTLEYISNKNKKDREYNISLFDAPGVDDNYILKYINGNSFYGALYYKSGGTYSATNKWKENAETAYTTIQQRLLNDIARQYITPIKIINGTIKGAGITYNNVVVVPNDDSAHYLINRLVTDKLRLEMQVELLELKRYSAEYLQDEVLENILDENGDPISVF